MKRRTCRSGRSHLNPRSHASIASVGSDGLLPARFPSRLDHGNDSVVARRPRLHPGAGQFERQLAKGGVYRSRHPLQPSEPDDLPIEKVRLDRAAKIRGKTRSDFRIDAAYRAAEDTLLDQTLVKVDAESYRRYLEILDRPPSGEAFARLMNAPKPWQG